MSYEHGVSIQESSVGARPAVQLDSALPVYVGAAPVHETSRRGNVNIPLLFSSLGEAVEAFGPIDSGDGYSLNEPIRAHFSTYETGPIICINVLDPDNPAHVSAVVNEVHAVVDADDPIPLTHESALAVSQVERSTTGDNVVENIVYAGTGNGMLAAVLIAPADPADVGNYSATCVSAAVPEDYDVENVVYVGTGNGTLAAILTDVDPTDAGAYTLTCTAPAAGPIAATFQLAKGGVPVGAPIDADGTTQERGGIAIAINEGGIVFLLADAWAFDIVYTAAIAAVFTVVTPTTPGGIAVDADGAPHVCDGIRVTITEGATPFAPADAWTFEVNLSAVAWTVVDPADYSLVYNADTDDAELQPEPGGAIVDGDSIRVDYTWLDQSGIVSADIVGTYAGGLYTGLEVVHQVYPRLLLVPTLILAPRWSHVAAVAAKMRTVGRSVSGQFRALAVCDLSADKDDIATYSNAAAWKTAAGMTAEDGVCCWPALESEDEPCNMSVHFACLCGVVDHAHSDLPYASPSNNALTTDGAVQTDAGAVYREVFLQQSAANDSLNAFGIVTAIQGQRGWVLWGNRTGIYPADTDPRVAFIPVRRMFNHIHNTIILTSERDLDQPILRRFIDGVVSTIQAWLNSLIAAGGLVDGTISFDESKNPTDQLAAGKVVFSVFCAPPSPAEDIQFDVTYDPSLLSALF